MSRSGLGSIATSLAKLSSELSTNPTPEKQGGCLVRMSGDLTKGGDFTWYSEVIGSVPQNEKLARYQRFAPEKVFRTYAEWLRNPETSFSSWQTRDESTNKYGGAVLFQRANGTPEVISFSGLKEHIDESLVLVLGYHLGILLHERLQRVLETSQNPSFEEMFAKAKERKIIV